MAASLLAAALRQRRTNRLMEDDDARATRMAADFRCPRARYSRRTAIAGRSGCGLLPGRRRSPAIVGGSEGGGFDTLARAIGRHIGKHPPGNPTCRRQTMPGGRHAGHELPVQHGGKGRHPSSAVVQSNTPPEPLLRHQGGALRAPQSSPGSARPVSGGPGCSAWHTVPVNTVEDLRITARWACPGPNRAYLGRLFEGDHRHQDEGSTATRAERHVPSRWSAASCYPWASTTARLALLRRGRNGCPISWRRPFVQYGSQRCPELSDVPFGK